MFDSDTLTNSEYHRHAKEIEAAEDEWEVERAHENAAERTLDAIKRGSDAVFDELEIGQYENEAALIVQALQLAAMDRDDAVIAAAVKELLACVAKNRDASFWREADERTRRIRDAWHLSNSIAGMACGLNVRGAA